MLAVLGELFVGILKESVDVTSFSIVQSNGRFITNKIRYIVNNAQTVNTPASLGDSTNSLEAVVNGVQLRVYILDGILYLNDGSGDYAVNSVDTRVSNAAFSRYGNAGGKHVITASFTVASDTEGIEKVESSDFRIAGGLR